MNIEEEFKIDLSRTIESVDQELSENNNWLANFDKSADDILKAKEKKEELSKCFRKYNPFKYYITVSEIKKGVNTLYVDVRYLGQNVAQIKVKDKNLKREVTISTKVKKIKEKEKSKKDNEEYDIEYSNKRYFGCEKKLNDVPWNGKEAREFRNIFREFDNASEEYKDKVRSDINKHNDEHKIQDLLFSEFIKASSKNKLLSGIQPVTFAGYFFSMVTPVSASSKEIKLGAYNGAKGGGIDILARTSGGKLTVIEVKDQNVPEEPIKKVLEQATGYATSIIYLLRNSTNADKWYKIFGFKRPLPKSPLTIRVCSAMPLKEDGSCDKFENLKCNYGKDILEYHWIYFKERDGKLLDIDSDLK